MNQETQDSGFEKRTREVLDESASRLDGRSLSKLTQARHAALEQLQRPARSRWWFFAPAGAAAAVAVLAVMTWTGGTRPTVTAPVAALNEDLEFLSDADAEIVAEGEDLEFYEWAAGEVES
jgi:hypothetical protein